MENDDARHSTALALQVSYSSSPVKPLTFPSIQHPSIHQSIFYSFTFPFLLYSTSIHSRPKFNQQHPPATHFHSIPKPSLAFPSYSSHQSHRNIHPRTSCNHSPPFHNSVRQSTSSFPHTHNAKPIWEYSKRISPGVHLGKFWRRSHPSGGPFQSSHFMPGYSFLRPCLRELQSGGDKVSRMKEEWE